MTTPTESAPQSAPEPGAPRRSRRIVLGLVKLAILGLLVAFLLRQGVLQKVPGALEKALHSPGALTLAFSLMAIGISASGVRWLILLRGEGIQLSLAQALQLTWIGHFFNMVLPGAVSGDAVKMYYVGQANPELRDEAWTTVVADRMIGLVALITLSALAALSQLEFVWNRPQLRYTFLTMVALLVGVALVTLVLGLQIGRNSARLGRLVGWLPFASNLGKGYGVLTRLTRKPGTVLVTFGLSFVAHGVAVTNGWVLGGAVDPQQLLSLLDYYALMPVALFASAFPLTPGGLGVGETVLGQLFEWSGRGSQAHGVTVLLLYRAIFYVGAGAGALLYVFYKRNSPRGPVQPPQPADPNP